MGGGDEIVEHVLLPGERALRVPLATATVPLIAPMSQFEPRRTQIDLRLTRVLQLSGRVRVRANLDLYNALNDGSVVNPNINFGA